MTEPDRLPVGAEAQGSDVSLDLGTASDLQLVVATARYDQDALAEVYKRHGGVALGLAKRGSQATTAWPRRSCRRSSSGSGTSPRSSTPLAARSAPTSSRRSTVGPST